MVRSWSLGAPLWCEAGGSQFCNNEGMAPRRRSGRSPGQRRRRVLGGLIDDANGVLQSVANEVAPVVIDAIDLNDVIERIDIQEVVERIDMNALLAGVDMNALIDQIDVEQVVDKLDLDAILARIDLAALIERTDMGAIIAATSSGMVSKAVDVARSQGVGIDFLLQRWSDRLHRRHSSAKSEALLPIHEQGPVIP
jgi:hypothetical protein